MLKTVLTFALMLCYIILYYGVVVFCYVIVFDYYGLVIGYGLLSKLMPSFMNLLSFIFHTNCKLVHLFQILKKVILKLKF